MAYPERTDVTSHIGGLPQRGSVSFASCDQSGPVHANSEVCNVELLCAEKADEELSVVLCETPHHFGMFSAATGIIHLNLVQTRAG